MGGEEQSARGGEPLRPCQPKRGHGHERARQSVEKKIRDAPSRDPVTPDLVVDDMRHESERASGEITRFELCARRLENPRIVEGETVPERVQPKEEGHERDDAGNPARQHVAVDGPSTPRVAGCRLLLPSA
jgi:hypothetical protein